MIYAVISILLVIGGWTMIIFVRPRLLRNEGFVTKVNNYFPRKMEVIAGVLSCLAILSAMLNAIYSGKLYISVCLIMAAVIGFIPSIVKTFIEK